VLGFDDFDWAANFSPRLTTVAQPSFEMGRQAMQMLLRKMKSLRENDHSIEDKVMALKAELRVRDSTAPPFSAEFAPKFDLVTKQDPAIERRAFLEAGRGRVKATGRPEKMEPTCRAARHGGSGGSV
jgi:hypothetical protein